MPSSGIYIVLKKENLLNMCVPTNAVVSFLVKELKFVKTSLHQLVTIYIKFIEDNIILMVNMSNLQIL